MTAVLGTVPELDPARIDDVVWGAANQAGEDNRDVGRMAVLLAGLPVSVPAVTVNRLCGSSLDAVISGSRAIESGDAEVILTGGVESMTRAPWVLPKPQAGFPAGDVTAVSTTLGWRLVNARMPKEWTVSLGEANEQLTDRFGIDRDRTGSPPPPGKRASTTGSSYRCPTSTCCATRASGRTRRRRRSPD
jgi:acetyl-CoA acyltransferase